MSSVGAITGTPTAEVASSSFTVVASATSAKSAEATFSLTIKKAETGGNGEYVFEAEYIDLTGLRPGGLSGSPEDPLDMVQSSPNASNGYYLGLTHRENNAFKFNITSSVAVSVPLVVRLSTETGRFDVNGNVFALEVNGTSVEYAPFSIPDNTGTGLFLLTSIWEMLVL